MGNLLQSPLNSCADSGDGERSNDEPESSFMKDKILLRSRAGFQLLPSVLAPWLYSSVTNLGSMMVFLLDLKKIIWLFLRQILVSSHD